MEFTYIGIAIIGVALWSFVFSPRDLYRALIISIPFSATAVINFTWAGAAYGETQKSLMAWQLFAILWVVREAFSGLPQWQRRGWFLTRRSRYWLVAFLVALAASLSVPLILKGTAWAPTWVNSLSYRGPADVPLQFSSYNVTQSAYIVFGVLFAVFIAAENWRTEKLLYTLKLYVSSCFFAAAWGLFQLACNLMGYAYAANVFNTSKNISALGYTETLGTGSLAAITRISSVATEPSVLAEELLLALVILLVCLGLKRPILHRGWNWSAVILFGVVLLASTSSTAYAGILAAVLLSAVALARAGSRRWKLYVAFTLGILATGALLVMVVPLVTKIFQAAVMLKYVNGSGHTRIESVQLALESFWRYPILGVGWGDASCWDLVVLLLSNLGLVGFFTFLGFLFPVIGKLWHFTAQRNLAAILLFPALALALILAEGDGLGYGLAYFWFVFGLAAGAVVAAKVGVARQMASRELTTT